MPQLPVIVVGAGIAGVSCARELAAAGLPVRLRERAYTPGGRMASRTLAGRKVDMGASYFTVRTDEFRAVVDDWTARGLVREWTRRFATRGPDGWGESRPGPVRYGTPDGLRSLVEDLATGLEIATLSEVTDVGPGPTVDGEPAAAVVLAMPDPQASDLLADELADELALVGASESKPTIALAAGWGERCWGELDGVFVDDPELSWVADDGRRRGDGAPVLVAHTTPAFSEPHLDRPADAAAPALAALLRVMEIDREPDWTYLHRWSLASPAEPHDQPYHLGESLVGICGDAWGSPRVETAYLSGRALGRELAERLTAR